MLWTVRAVSLLGAALAFWPNFGSHEPRWAFILVAGCAGLIATRRLTGLDMMGLTIVGWSALSLSWSSDPGEGLTTIVPLVGLFGVFLLFEHGPRFDLGPIAVVATIGALCLGILYPDVNGGFFNQNWLTEFLVLSGLIAVLRGGPLGLASALSAWTWAILYNSSFAWIAALGALIVALCLVRRWYWAAAIIMLAGINLLIFVAPRMGREIALSLTSRYELWINTVSLWLKNPLFGGGLGSYNHDYSSVMQDHLSLMGQVRFQNVFLYPGYVHNDALNILVEIGVVGLVLCLAFCFVALRRQTRETVWPLAGLAGISMIAFPLFLPSTAFWAAALIGIASRQDSLASSSALDWWRRYGGRFGPIWPSTRHVKGLATRRFGHSCKISTPIA